MVRGNVNPIINESQAEGNQTFSLLLSNAVGGATITGPTNMPVTILDDDTGLSFSAPAYVVSETGGTVSLTVLRPSGTNMVTTVNYSTTNLTAQAGTEFTQAVACAVPELALAGLCTWLALRNAER